MLQNILAPGTNDLNCQCRCPKLKMSSPRVHAIQHLLGLASYHLLFQVVEHSDPEQHPAQRKPTGHNKALTTCKRWVSRTNTPTHTHTPVKHNAKEWNVWQLNCNSNTVLHSHESIIVVVVQASLNLTPCWIYASILQFTNMTRAQGKDIIH